MSRCVPLLVVMLTACQDQRPPAPTAEDSAALDAAGGMLDNFAVNEKEPVDRSTGSSKSSD
ncbi:MAG: hypothetical protein LH466_10200 [Sphingomonas bacterium]|nr:hypothetical protein [Sphingomonas bacterium]